MLIKNLSDINEDFVLTIGNFDGVHLGHKSLLDQIISKQSQKLPVAVITFDPHPQVVLQSRTGFLIEDPHNKPELLTEAGSKYVVLLKFTRDFSTLSPDEFIQKYVFINSHLKEIFIGHDFNFGSNKQGGIEDFKKLAKQKNVLVTHLEAFSCEGRPISSSIIREHLKAGEIKTANKLLGRSYSLSGRVIKGQGRGRLIGFPTANIEISVDRLIPLRGVYSTLVKFKDLNFKSVTNIGINPTFGENQLTVETNILDFDNDIYGEKIEVQFLSRIRDERKFSSVNELVEQIRKDIAHRRELND